jgi:hypothetical protein
MVRAMFTSVELDGVRLLSQKRLLADWSRLEEKRQMLAENGRKGRKAQLEPSNSSAHVGQMPGNRPADAPQLLGKEVKGSKESEVREVREERKTFRASHIAPKPGAVHKFPDWIPPDTWNAFIEMRTKIRKPLTTRAVELAIKELGKLKAAGHDPKLVLEQSVLKSYAGLFPLPMSGNATSVQPRPIPQRKAWPELNDTGRAIYEKAGVIV